MTFYEILDKRGFDMRTFATRISRKEATIYNWCRGSNIPKPTTMGFLAHVLKYSEEEILEALQNSKDVKIHVERECGCGCGRTFIKKRNDHTYFSVKCKTKAIKEMHRGKLGKKTCTCGCGKVFLRKRKNQMYYTKQCRVNHKNSLRVKKVTKQASRDEFNTVIPKRKTKPEFSHVQGYSRPFIQDKVTEFLSRGGKIEKLENQVVYDSSRISEAFEEFDRIFSETV